MTQQALEKLLYQDVNWYMREYPLNKLTDPVILERLSFRVMSTDCWRGYIGTWAIREDRLYLIDIEGRMSDGSDAKLLSIFPGADQGIFAQWVTGWYRIFRSDVPDWEWRQENADLKFERAFAIKDGVVQPKRLR